MPLTSAQICNLATQDAKCPGFLSQAGQFLNATLQDLCQNYDLDAALGTFTFSFNSSAGQGSGPYNLPTDYLRTQVKDGKDEFFYTIQGVPYPLIQITKAEYDWLVQTPGFNSFPYNYATDLSQSPAQLFVWPPSSGSYPCVLRYYRLMPDIPTPETSATIPWFNNTMILQRSVAGRLMGLTDDDRQEKYLGDDEDKYPLGYLTLLKKYMKNVEDREGAVHTVGKDRRRWGRPFDQLKNTKNIGWALAAMFLGAWLYFGAAAPTYANCTTPCTKPQITTDINTNWPDNTTGLITPALLRSTVNDLLFSYLDIVNAAANSIKCNPTGAPANVIDCTGAQVESLLQFTQSGTGAVQRFLDAKVKDYPITVTDFGAACNGSTDDTSAIQAAINSLPNDGGIILFPSASNCKISTTLTVGNGTTSAVSTKRGVVLRGAGVPNTPTGLPTFNGYTTSTGPKLTWAGGATPMISIAGPLQGWGLQNLVLDCASVTGSTGIGVVSAQFGDNSNLTVLNCGSVGISSLTNPLGGYTGVGNVDSLRNNWTNIFVLVPNVAAAKGILLNGDSGGTSDTDYNVFTNVFIRGAGTAATFGLYLGVNDANIFANLSVSGFATAGAGITFDYSINNGFPGSDTFIQYEIGGNTPFNIIGSPGALATPNKFYGLIQANAAPAPIIANTQAIDGPWIAYTPTVTCGTATFTINSARFKTIGKRSWVEGDISFTAIGTCTNSMSIGLPNTSNSAGGLVGREIALSFKGFNCSFGSAATAANCVQSDLTAFGATSHVQYSGTYENQ